MANIVEPVINRSQKNGIDVMVKRFTDTRLRGGIRKGDFHAHKIRQDVIFVKSKTIKESTIEPVSTLKHKIAHSSGIGVGKREGEVEGGGAERRSKSPSCFCFIQGGGDRKAFGEVYFVVVRGN